MSTEKEGKSGKPPQIVTLNKASKLAEHWVNNMSKDVGGEETETELEGRPLNLGLGAKAVRQSKVTNFDDPVERKLHAKLEAGKRKAAGSVEESNGKDDNIEEEDSDEELESRTNAFSKKIKGPPQNSSLPVNKKLK